MAPASSRNSGLPRLNSPYLNKLLPALVLILLLIVRTSAFAQGADKGSGDICSVLERKDEPLLSRGFPGLRARENQTTQQIVDEILAYSGLKPGSGTPQQIEAIATSHREVHGNAEAKICGNYKQYIFYDPQYFESLGGASGTSWPQYFLFAHEVGHHLFSHSLNDAGDRMQLEMNADRFAAFTLARMGAPLQDVLRAVDMIADERDIGQHPSRKSREAAVQEGYRNNMAQLPQDSGLPIRQPQSLRIPSVSPAPAGSASCKSPTGDLSYESACASCDRLRGSILENERNGTVASGGRMSFFNSCTFKGINLAVPAPSPSAKLSDSDYRQCVQTRLQIADFEQSHKLPAATLNQIKGAYRAGFCERAETQPTSVCERYLQEWQDRANYQYRNQPGAMQSYENALRQTLHANHCPGF
jgi:hypothetical protein